jgi:hypothetical protein
MAFAFEGSWTYNSYYSQLGEGAAHTTLIP